MGPVMVAAVASLVCGASPDEAQAAEPERRVVVRSFAPASDALAEEAERVTEAVLVHLSRRAGLRVIGEAELDLLWAHADEMQLMSPADCERARECLAALTDATDADLVLNGQVGRFGGERVVTLSLSDARKVTVIGGASCLGPGEPEVLACLDDELGRLFGGGESTARFRLDRRAKIMVMDFESHDVPEGLASGLTQIVSVELKSSDELEVIGWSEVKAMLDYSVERATLCDEDLTKCFAEIGGALGVDYLLQGAVGRLDQTWVLHLKLLDVGKADVASRIVENYRGPKSHLPHAGRHAVRSLLGQPAAGEGGLVLVDRADTEARVTLDDDPEPRNFEGRLELPALPAGKHAITVHAEDHLPFHANAYVFADQTNRLDFELEALPTPWYESWWFWTGVGTVLTAAGVTTYLLLDEPRGNNIGIRVQP